METLQASLDTITRQSKATMPMNAFTVLENSIASLQQAGIANGLPVGHKARDFTLTNANGNQVNLYEELTKGPIILTFYRGSWCPYCNRQLRAYEEILPDIKKIGGSLIAISPQTPDNSLTIKEKNDLSYEVVSDLKGLTAAKYNVLFDVPQEVKEVYNQFGLDLSEYNGGGNWVIPVPSTFMIDETSRIRFSYVNPNYMQRLEPEDLLTALRNL
ncbi:peroxiredoxin-like family protein [Cytobacillus sp. IB215665]|uniref:peroxiredoxin-like family protein n=1 Tax=Cytobacillus sp. IB215665 TaxID=3097357 RepID=UPI002A180BF0|nr:peroxiredoxin-like family protein [Cytobacillus sp. IB215665]MDX8365593.1 peroxiredoxin-like family protein [Cytobacillus sp. IB215665]